MRPRNLAFVTIRRARTTVGVEVDRQPQVVAVTGSSQPVRG
jgi:hypothetical protein